MHRRKQRRPCKNFRIRAPWIAEEKPHGNTDLNGGPFQRNQRACGSNASNYLYFQRSAGKALPKPTKEVTNSGVKSTKSACTKKKEKNPMQDPFVSAVSHCRGNGFTKPHARSSPKSAKVAQDHWGRDMLS